MERTKHLSKGMKISIPITEDTFNSYPIEELIFVIYDEEVQINISDDKERKVTINKKKLIRLLRILEV